MKHEASEIIKFLDTHERIGVIRLVLQDSLANALSTIMNAEVLGKKNVIIEPASKVITATLRVIQEYGGIGEFEFIDNGKSGLIKVQLSGRIAKVGVIKPRYAVQLKNFKTWEKQYLPANNFGILIVSTPKGIMSHREAVEKRTGGRLLAFVY